MIAGTRNKDKWPGDEAGDMMIRHIRRLPCAPPELWSRLTKTFSYS
jgi:hypothetical protein